ncbi:MAG: type I methionyl aminopeptidase [Saprospiraceae bacterium]|jgi:methionyl aminopeptidase|nr:type I methionyl aminopeptidase [Saprospiraceae bacterium]MBP9209262.1 type I methionyl aminopeptidase [Saprospiraceae bacterium]MBV6473039.1 Methionine aminopeptidase 1 [Saprospiraceae bacterium]
MIYLKSEEEIQKIRHSCQLVSRSLALVGQLLRPGITGSELDAQAGQFIRDHAAIPAFKGYNGFPASLCISINEQVVHGIPSALPMKDGDVVSVDCGVLCEGYYGDAAYTFAIGEVGAEILQLMRVTLESLALGIAQAHEGNRIGDISFAIQEHAEQRHGYGVVRELVGHGIGKQLHEPPEVPNFGKRGSGISLKEGLVLAIEPMINLGTRRVKQLKDGWTIITQDKKVSAHYEHTVVVRRDRAEILSDHAVIEDSVKNNKELTGIA